MKVFTKIPINLANSKKKKKKRRELYHSRGTIHQEDLTTVNIDAPNLGAPKYINQLITNIKKLIDDNIIIVRDLNTPVTAMDRSPV